MMSLHVMVALEPRQSSPLWWGAMNPQNVLGRRGGSGERLECVWGAEEAGDVWKCSFSTFIVRHAFFTSFNLFCSNSQVKNSFHEPEPAATALRPAMALRTIWRPCPCIPPPTAEARTPRSGHEAQGTQLAPSPSLLQLHSPTPIRFPPHSCSLVLFGVKNLLCIF